MWQRESETENVYKHKKLKSKSISVKWVKVSYTDKKKAFSVSLLLEEQQKWNKSFQIPDEMK